MAELAPYAAKDETSRGRSHREEPSEYRNEFQRDRDRIVHSAAFRRLEYKTQVFVNHEGDMFRTRLTHSIEVAQIARTAARALKLNEDLTEAVALAHDLGHTPFGHAGQDALNACMKKHGGFEHNLQSLRVVDVLEEKYARFPGLNLTFEAREGILKHCSRANARKLGDVAERFLSGGQPGLEAQLANLADEVAYNNHDVDDGLRAGLIDVEQLQDVQSFAGAYATVRDEWPDLPSRRIVHEVIRRMIHLQVVDMIQSSRLRIKASGVTSIEEVRKLSKPLMGFSDDAKEHHLALKQFLRTRLYRHHRVHRMAAKAGRVLTALFDVFMDDLRLMPAEFQSWATRLETDEGLSGRARAVSDYIAGMTDRYALAEHGRLFDPNALT